MGVSQQQKCSGANNASPTFVQRLQSLVYLFRSQQVSNLKLFVGLFVKWSLQDVDNRGGTGAKQDNNHKRFHSLQGSLAV